VVVPLCQPQALQEQQHQAQQQVMEPQLLGLCSAQMHLRNVSTPYLGRLVPQGIVAGRLLNHLQLQYSKASCLNRHPLQDSFGLSCSCVLLPSLEPGQLHPLGPCCLNSSSSCSSSDSQTFLQQGVAGQGWGHPKGPHCHILV
jgi:hypothetical protein